jgi:hypothetical protein
MYESVSALAAISLGLFWAATDVPCIDLRISQRALRRLYDWAYFRQHASCDAKIADVEPGFLGFHATLAAKLI